MTTAVQGQPDPRATLARYGASRIRGKRILYVDTANRPGKDITFATTRVTYNF